MTATESILEKAIARQKFNERKAKAKKVFRYINSIALSFTLPLLLSLLATLLLPWLFPNLDKGNLQANFIYCFCKIFFICTPFQVFFIVKRNHPKEYIKRAD